MNSRDRDRKLAAIRTLAERPGTEAEGIAARAALERLGATAEDVSDPWELFREFLRTGDMETLWMATKGHSLRENLDEVPATQQKGQDASEEHDAPDLRQFPVHTQGVHEQADQGKEYRKQDHHAFSIYPNTYRARLCASVLGIIQHVPQTKGKDNETYTHR